MDCRPSLLIVGDTRRGEFREALLGVQNCCEEELGSAASQARSVAAANADDAAALLAAGEFAPEVIVLVEARPGEFSQAAVDRLRSLAPLARVVGLSGSWCEGEMRTGRPLSGVVRLYWHQWRYRARQALDDMAAGQLSAWSLPATATDEERLLFAANSPWPARAGLVAIHTPSFEMADFLSAACRQCGYASAWVRDDHGVRLQGASAGIFDVRELDDRQQQRLRAFANSLRPAPIAALMDFPRIDDALTAHACGAAAVLSKPLVLEDLWDALHIAPKKPYEAATI